VSANRSRAERRLGEMMGCRRRWRGATQAAGMALINIVEQPGFLKTRLLWSGDRNLNQNHRPWARPGSTRTSPIARVDGSIAATTAGHSHHGVPQNPQMRKMWKRRAAGTAGVAT
jgi:hypothetical protein